MYIFHCQCADNRSYHMAGIHRQYICISTLQKTAANKKSDVIASTVLGSMVIFDNVFLGIITIPVCLASMTILHCSTDSIAYYKTTANSSPMAATLLCIFAGGGTLAALNILLAVSSTPLHPGFHVSYLFSALQAGIFEEICFRLFLSAYIVQLRKQERFTSVGHILVYGILILPHVLFHFPQSLDIGSILILSLLFGLPFSIMMKKVNLVSAIGAHVMVDAVRFLMLGI